MGMQATTYYEFERPEGWNGEYVDMSKYEGEVDYYELEIEGNVVHFDALIVRFSPELVMDGLGEDGSTQARYP